MSRRALLLILWLLVGHALAFSGYVALVNVPDANVAMLGLSGLLAVVVILVAAVTDAAALLWLLPGTTFGKAFRQACRRGFPAAVFAAAVFMLVAATADRLGAWHAAHSGEIDAWFVATLGTADSAWVHRLIGVVLSALRAIVGVSLALALFAAMLVGGLPAVVSLGWVARALSRYQLGLVALAMTMLVALPWRAVGWRPAWIPPSWLEPAFVSVKIGLVLVVVHAGWALVLFAAARGASGPRTQR